MTGVERSKSTGPYGLPVLESCLTCVLRADGLLCNLSEKAQAELSSIRQTAFYPEGATLYVEGSPARGLYILCAGKAKLSATSRDGKSVTLRLVMPGEVMGLSCVMANRPYQSSAVTLQSSEISFVPRLAFIDFLRNHNEASLRVAEHLSIELHRAWEQTRLLALAPNARAKLAQVLMLWAGHQGQPTNEGIRIPLNMSQESVGEAIGATRETVSRLFSDFQKEKVIRIKGGSVLLLNPEQLRAIGDS